MRILFLTNNPFPPREGIAHHLAGLAQALKARGHRPFVLARGDRFTSWRQGRFRDLDYGLFPFLPLRPFHHSLARPLLQQWLNRHESEFDLVHVHLPLLPPLRTRLPLAVTVHTPLTADTRAIREPGLLPRAIRLNAKLFSRRYEQWYLDHADLLLAVSSRVADELRCDYRLGGGGARVLPNGVDTRFFSFRPLAGRQPIVLYLGRLGYRKGLERLIDAFSLLQPSSLQLVLVGEGPLRCHLENRVARAGLADRIIFAGFAGPEGVRDWLHRACCLVHPSDYEGFPLVLLEAMACGTPVVTTPIGALADLGPAPPLTVVDADPLSVAEGIARLLEAPGATSIRTARARALVEHRFDWRKIAAQLEDFYAGAEQRWAA